MGSLSKLTPTIIWEYFEDICSIPRPSKHEDKILAYIINFAKKHNLEYSQDAGKNIIIKKKAFPGFENRQTVALQAHVDMVPQKNSDKEHNFITDPIEPYIDGDWVRANKTTLGADNGIGLAVILAVLESENIPHGPIEALFTTDEETGMTGANLMSKDALTAKYMINTDTEDEHEITVGCAGGLDANLTFPFETEKIEADYTTYNFSISGLTGGHSGFEIILERANANVILCDFLNIASKKYGARIADVQGGNMRNAIPREGSAHILIPNAKTEDFDAFSLQFANQIKTTFKESDPLLHCVITECSPIDTVICYNNSQKFIQAMQNCPNGVISLENDTKDIVKTSINISIISTKSKEFEVNCLLRSSSTNEKIQLAHSIEQNCKLFGGKAHFDGEYPAWQPIWNSHILSILKRAYSELTNINPEVKVVHAGLECGIFSGKYPNMEFISFGPNIRGPHSPDERVEIRTVEQFWKLLQYVLKNIPNA